MSEGPLRRPRVLMVALAAASLLAITMLPAISATAASKIFSLSVTPATAPAGSNADFLVTMTNRSPGNSNPNSFSISIPVGFSIVGTPTISSASNPTNLSVTPQVDGSTVKVQNLTPVKTNEFVTVKIPLSTPSSGCGFAFTANVWGGSNLSGSTFSPAPAFPYPPTVSLDGAAAVATKLAITTLFDEEVGTEILSADTPAHFLARPSSSTPPPFPFTVVVEAQDDSGAAAPVCGDTTVTLSVPDEAEGTLAGTVQKVLANGATSVTFGGLTYVNGGVSETVVLTAAGGTLDPGTATVDFNASLEVKAGSPGTADSLTTSGTCTPTATTPFCVTWTLPNGWSQTAALFVQDCPEGECDFGLLAAFIANLKDVDGVTPLYNNSEPFDFFTLDIGCDRSVCGGGRLSRYVIYIDPDDLAGPLGYIESPACTPSVRDFVDPYNIETGQTFCTDYSGAHRDNNQDSFWQVRAADIDGRGKM